MSLSDEAIFLVVILLIVCAGIAMYFVFGGESEEKRALVDVAEAAKDVATMSALTQENLNLKTKRDAAQNALYAAKYANIETVQKKEEEVKKQVDSRVKELLKDKDIDPALKRMLGNQDQIDAYLRLINNRDFSGIMRKERTPDEYSKAMIEAMGDYGAFNNKRAITSDQGVFRKTNYAMPLEGSPQYSDNLKRVYRKQFGMDLKPNYGDNFYFDKDFRAYIQRELDDMDKNTLQNMTVKDYNLMNSKQKKEYNDIIFAGRMNLKSRLQLPASIDLDRISDPNYNPPRMGGAATVQQKRRRLVNQLARLGYY